MLFSRSNIKDSKKGLALLLAAGLLFVMLFSTVYLFENADHICNDTDCSVCMMMKQCSETIRTAGAALFVSVVSCFAHVIGEQKPIRQKRMIPNHSLISQKVRLDI